MSGIASRRAAEEVVLAGEVRINGKVVESLGTQVDPEHDTVTVRGKRVAVAEHVIYIIMNKPKDYITTAKDEKDRRTVYDLLSIRERVFPIGRLDRNTTGVLLFTNDGFLATKLMHPSSEVKKEYHVSIDHSLDEAHRDKLCKGIYLEEGKTSPAEIVPIPGTKSKEIVVTIHEGRNRQVRRMFEALGYEIVHLNRISYGGLTAAGLAKGKWRFLTNQEIRSLKSLVGQSEGTPSASRAKTSRPAKRPGGQFGNDVKTGKPGKRPNGQFGKDTKTGRPGKRTGKPTGKDVKTGRPGKRDENTKHTVETKARTMRHRRSAGIGH
ncbi:MAG TPA: pseudouridine synthase [Bacteroidota bacterium]|nr:pseudouridine synthase [Bacteroidota bacterium]